MLPDKAKLVLGTKKLRRAGWLPGILALLFSVPVSAQDLEARSYSVIPKGMHAAALSYTYTNGNVVSGVVLPFQDPRLSTSIINMAYVQTFGLFNKLARIQVAQPVGFLKGSAREYGVDTNTSRSGFFDTRIKIGLNLIGSPLLSPKDFVRFQESSVLGVSIAFSLPTGQYFPDKVINLGTNRWGFKPEIGFSHREGRLFYEFYTGVWLFTTNNNFYKNYPVEQKPLFNFQAHVDYVFKSNIWVAVNGGYADGGQNTINGTEINNQEKNWRLGTTFSLPLNKHQSVKAMFNTGVDTRVGQNYTAFTLVYQYIWF